MKSLLILSTVVILMTASVSLAQPILTVTPDAVETSGDIIEIKWTGIESPTSYDKIAIYYPPDADVDYPIGWVACTNSSTWKEGYGMASIPLVNVRETYVFRLWLGKQETVSSMSNNVTFVNPSEPGKAYLARTNSTSEMRVNWISGHASDTPFVFWGLTPQTMNNTASGTTRTYTVDQLCGSVASSSTYFRDPGMINDAVMTGLTPSTQYYYYVGSESTGTSKVYNFISAPEISTEAYVIAFGDLGLQVPFIGNFDLQQPAIMTVANMYTVMTAPFDESPFTKKLGLVSAVGDNTQPPWNIHHIGDISYARGKSFVWDYYQDFIEKVASMGSYMVSIGNHEYDYSGQPFAPSWSDYGGDSGGECGVPYDTRYHMPGAEGTPQQNRWYSYEQGPIHFTMMSAEEDFLVGSPQYNWILQDLQSVDRTRTPWLIFSGHRPMYDSVNQETETGMYSHLQDAYEPLFVEYDVNMGFFAHVHAYERTCGMTNWTCTANDNEGTVHILMGMAGNTDINPWAGEDDDSEGDGEKPQPDFSVFRTQNFGYTRFFANMTDLYFDLHLNWLTIYHILYQE
eukprot:gene15456-18338_t